MRLLIPVLILLTAALLWWRQNAATPPQASSTTQPTATMPQTGQPADQLIAPDNTAPDKPSAAPRQQRPQISLQDLNLDLPDSLEPSVTPVLNLPDNRKLLLPEKKAPSPGISIGGGLEWDDKEDRAKGAKISITIPTG